MTTRSLALLAALLPVLAAAGPPATPGTIAEPAGGDPTAWIGRWELDDDLSDSPDDMMKVMEVPWYMRALAGTFRPNMTIEAKGGGIQITSKNPLGTRVETLYADGEQRAIKDLLDRPAQESSRWQPDGSLAIDRLITLESGRKARLDITWTVAGPHITTRVVAHVGDAPPVEMKRVFEKVPAG